MGVARQKPVRLPEKLTQIRLALGLSQTEMLRQLELGEGYYRSSISGYEIGTREAPLPVLLRYAKLAGIFIDVLVDDDLDLPAKLPMQADRERVLKRFHH